MITGLDRTYHAHHFVFSQTVACSIVASRLDYCNAILYGASAATFDVLQRVQNNLARVVCQSRGRVDARPLLRSLHWLPVRQRVTQDGDYDVQGDVVVNTGIPE